MANHPLHHGKATLSRQAGLIEQLMQHPDQLVYVVIAILLMVIVRIYVRRYESARFTRLPFCGFFAVYVFYPFCLSRKC